MDNELDAIERSAVRDADDKQWYIECELLKIETMKAQALIDQAECQRVCEEARLQEAHNEAQKIKQLNKSDVNIESNCAYCGSFFKYSGDNADIADTSLMRFLDVHDPCGRN